MNIGIPNDYLVGGFKHVFFNNIYIYISIYILIYGTILAIDLYFSRWLKPPTSYDVSPRSEFHPQNEPAQVPIVPWTARGPTVLGSPLVTLGYPGFHQFSYGKMVGKWQKYHIYHDIWGFMMDFMTTIFHKTGVCFFQSEVFFSTRLGIEEYPGLMGFLP